MSGASSHWLSQVRAVTQVGLIFLVLQLPSLRALTRYLPYPEFTVPVFLAVAFCATFLVVHPPRFLVPVLSGPWPTLLILVAFTVGTILIYPYADGLKLLGQGSDGDDNLILAGHAILKLQNPYAEITYLGNQIAPGIGWMLAALPFSVTGLYSLFFPSTLALAFWCLRSCGTDWLTVNQFALLLASCLLVWELGAVGSDYFPFAMLVLVAILLLQKPDLPAFGVIGLVLMVGVLATFRIVFILLPLLIGFSLWARHPRRAMAVALGGTSLAAAAQIPFILPDPWSHPPLDLLLSRTESEFAPIGIALSVAIFAVAVTAMLINWRTWPPITHLAVGLGVPWAIVAAANAVNVHGDLPNWGGASALAFSLPFAVLALLLMREPDETRFQLPQRLEHCR